MNPNNHHLLKKIMISNRNLDRCYKELQDQLLSAYQEIQLSGQVRNGKYCRLAENELKKITGRKHARICPSGTQGLLISILAWKIQGYEIASSPYSYVASTNQAAMFNTMKYYDINANGVLDVNRKFSEQVILPISLYGHTCDYDTMFANILNDATVIVDSAQSLGSTYKGQPDGSIGDVAVFSFAVNKPVPTCGHHGAIVWDNDDMTDRIQTVANNGKRSRNSPIESYGVNGEPFEIQASQIYYGLLNYKKWQDRRQQIAKYYSDEFKNLPLDIIKPNDWCESNHHKFVMLTKDRNELNAFLRANNIESELHYTDNFADFFANEKTPLPNTDKFCTQCITIPNSQWLTDAEIEHTSTHVKKFYESQSTTTH